MILRYSFSCEYLRNQGGLLRENIFDRSEYAASGALCLTRFTRYQPSETAESHNGYSFLFEYLILFREDDTLTVYETTFVLDGKTPEAEVEKLTEKFTNIITGAKGEIVKIEKLGKRELSYMIGSSKDGYYVYIEAKMDGEIVKELERNYRISDFVLRYLTIKKVVHKPIKKKKKKTVATPAVAATSTPAAAPAATPAAS
jgi:small subunit ribosomal protein S6